MLHLIRRSVSAMVPGMNEGELRELVRSIESLREYQRESVRETERLMRESRAETELVFQHSREEMDRSLMRTREELAEGLRQSRKEMDRALLRSKEKFDSALLQSKGETDKALRELSGLFSTQWGKLVEALVEPSCLDAFVTRGINIRRSFQRAEGVDSDGREMEVDVLLVNGNEVVAIEVKTTLKTADVEEHEQRLHRLKDAFPEYREKKVYGGVAALSFDSDSDRYAYKRGLFVMKPEKGLVRIVNDQSFIPKEF